MEKIAFISIGEDSYYTTGFNGQIQHIHIENFTGYSHLTSYGQGRVYAPIIEMIKNGEFDDDTISICIIHPDTNRGSDAAEYVTQALRTKFGKKTKIQSFESNRFNAPITDRLYAMESIINIANRGYQIVIVIADDCAINALINEYIGRFLCTGHKADFFSIGENRACVVQNEIKEAYKEPKISYYCEI